MTSSRASTFADSMAGLGTRLLTATAMATTETTTITTTAAAAAATAVSGGGGGDGGGGSASTRSSQWNISSVSAHRLMHLPPVPTSVSMVPRHPFPTVDVPDHAHYTIGIVILVVGITGMLGNFLVIYAFCRSRSLRTPANMFIINLAVTDLLMCVTQTPIFFTTSMHKRWIFGEKGCELYAFCGALFGICSMITLMAIATDRYVVITRPLASLGVMSRRRALCILAGAWAYSMGWSLPPFFGWSAYVPEGLLTSCSWDYMTFTPSVRSYTMLLFTFVFFIPLFIIIFCYSCIFRAIRHTTQAVCKINGGGTRDSIKKMHRMKGEWKMAKIALIVILLYVISWAPYSCVALTAFAGYADMLTPYMNSVPAVIAKASAIHNPIIYAITHPKYRAAISRYVPYLGVLLCVPTGDRLTSSSFQSTRRSTLTSQTSEFSRPHKPRLSSQSDSESGGFSDTEADLSRLPLSRQYSSDIKQVRHTSQRSKVRGRDSGVFERAAVHNPSDPSICHLSLISVRSEEPRQVKGTPKLGTQTDMEDISMSDFSLKSVQIPANEDKIKEDSGLKFACAEVTSIIVTSKSSPLLLRDQSGFRGDQGPTLKVLDTAILVAPAPQQIAMHDEALPCIAMPEPNQAV